MQTSSVVAYMIQPCSKNEVEVMVLLTTSVSMLTSGKWWVVQHFCTVAPRSVQQWMCKLASFVNRFQIKTLRGVFEIRFWLL